jgi:hypothetical protein
MTEKPRIKKIAGRWSMSFVEYQSKWDELYSEIAFMHWVKAREV